MARWVVDFFDETGAKSPHFS